ncbi:NTP transferase domain-containing protein [Paenibacillus sp. MCAF20]
MGRRKQELELMPGMTLGSMALHALLQCSVEEVVVVVHPSDPLNWLSKEFDERVLGQPSQDSPSVRIVISERADDGMAYSLRTGLEALPWIQPNGEYALPDAILVMLADQPFVDKTHLERLMDRYSKQSNLDYVASSSWNEENGTYALMPPAILSKSMFAAVTKLEGDTGARKLFADARYRGEAVSARSNGVLLDVDNPIDLELAFAFNRSVRP